MQRLQLSPGKRRQGAGRMRAKVHRHAVHKRSWSRPEIRDRPVISHRKMLRDTLVCLDSERGPDFCALISQRGDEHAGRSTWLSRTCPGLDCSVEDASSANGDGTTSAAWPISTCSVRFGCERNEHAMKLRRVTWDRGCLGSRCFPRSLAAHWTRLQVGPIASH